MRRNEIPKETRHAVLAISSFILGLALVLASLGLAGRAGHWLYAGMELVVGWGFFLFPLILFLTGFTLLRVSRPAALGVKSLGAGVFFLGGLGFLELVFGRGAGGLAGRLLASPLVALFDYYISLLIFIGLVIIASLIMLETNITLTPTLFGWQIKRRNRQFITGAENAEPAARPPEENPAALQDKKTLGVLGTPSVGDAAGNEALAAFTIRTPSARAGEKFEPPPLELLERDSGKPVAGDIKANANVIKRTLANFGMVVEMDEVSIGPAITRYALKPAEGVKLSRIVALQNDLALALAAHPIRIEAPIPGLALVGIEIPNRARATVGLASLIGSPAFTSSPFPLYVSLGRDIAGIPHFTNLARAPHLLIAGSTGSGKSVVIHTLITSLLYRNPPARVRFIMIDPKRVELTIYNKIPQLLTPVVTDAQKAIYTLKWAIGEMERRYGVLEEKEVRDIQSLHQKTLDVRGAPTSSVSVAETLPYIVIVIDELADIMSTYPRELEAAIVRLAQMSRAVGIHLILSTQRPSVEIITGLIKANIPARVALQVASQVDSRTILDMAGAEKLLGAGDMLYLSGERSKPWRLQSAFISETEVKRVVQWLVQKYDDILPEELPLVDLRQKELAGASGDGDDDELYDEARELVVTSGKASASYLQRRLKVGYARAARLLDFLEERGVIGPGEGAKARQVYPVRGREGSHRPSASNGVYEHRPAGRQGSPVATADESAEPI
ncbi:MAG: DNA translocase FtsK [Candidatus Vogelbacteria bacterium]|nr:DNA translocase FtsK [Candidatus Vogelbacteria bacterium]